MAKFSYSTLTTLTGASAVQTINANFQALQTAMDKALFRDGTSPNSMSADLDMNSNDILNLPAATAATNPVRKAEFDVLDAEFDTLSSSVSASITAFDTRLTTIETEQATLTVGLDNFDDLYLGAKSSDPVVDNDGDALQAGALYFNTTSLNLNYYTGSAWEAVESPSTITLDDLQDVTISSVAAGELVSWDGAAWINQTFAELDILTATTAASTYQPLDSDLTAIAALSTTSFGRDFLTETDASSTRTTIDVYSTSEVDSAIAAAVTAEDLDVAGDTGTIAIDLDSETFTLAGGTGIDTSAATNTLTIAIDSTVTTLSGSQTLTNKTIDLGDNTITGSITEFDAALQSDTFVFTSEVGSVVQAYDAGLASIAGLTTAADRMIYTTASDTYAVTTLTSFARQILDDSDASTVRATIDVDQAGTDNSTDVTLAGSLDYLTISGQEITRNAIDLSTDTTGSLAAASVSIADAGGLITATTVEGALAENRTAIDAIEADYLTSSDIGSSVQAYDSDLDTWAGLTPSANAQSLVTAANYAAMRTLLDLEVGTDFYSISATDSAIASAISALSSVYQPLDSDLTSWAGVTRAAGFDTFVATPSQANFLSLITDETFVLDSDIGSTVQAYDADLDTWATLTPSANAQSLVTAADYAAMRTLLDLEAGTDFYSISAADAAFEAIDSDIVRYDVAGAFTTDQDFQAQLEISEEFLIDGLISPAQITANQDDYAPTGIGTANVIRVDSDAARSITGLSASQVEGRVIILQNDGGFTITLLHENANSTAANRFDLGDDTDFSLVSGGTCLVIYDGTASRWRLLGGGSGGGDGSGLANVVEDVSPQAGGDFDMNTFDLGFDDNTGITDDDLNELLWFQKTASAVNYLEITNAATGNDPSLAAAGSDSNIDLELSSKGTGRVMANSEPVQTYDTINTVSADGSNVYTVDMSNGLWHELTVARASKTPTAPTHVAGDTMDSDTSGADHHFRIDLSSAEAGDVCVVAVGADVNAIHASVDSRHLVYNGFTVVEDSFTNSIGALISTIYITQAMEDQGEMRLSFQCESNSAVSGVASIWRGVDPLIYDVAIPTEATGATGLPNAPSITTVTDNSIVLAIGLLDDDNVEGTMTAPTNYTLRAIDDNDDALGITTAIASRLIASAGAENPGVYTGSGDDAWRAFSIALRPVDRWTEPEIQFSNVPSGLNEITLFLDYDGLSEPTWPSGITWDDGVASTEGPRLHEGLNIIKLYTDDGGTSWYGRNTSTGPKTDYQQFTSSGTWVKPKGGCFTRAKVRLVAGGGGSGTVFGGLSGGGGGGAGTPWVDFDLDDLGHVEQVIVGAGGAGGLSPTSEPGDTGGESRFGTWLQVRGGGPSENREDSGGGGGGGGSLFEAGSDGSGTNGGTGGSGTDWALEQDGDFGGDEKGSASRGAGGYGPFGGGGGSGEVIFDDDPSFGGFGFIGGGGGGGSTFKTGDSMGGNSLYGGGGGQGAVVAAARAETDPFFGGGYSMFAGNGGKGAHGEYGADTTGLPGQFPGGGAGGSREDNKSVVVSGADGGDGVVEVICY